MPVTQRRAIPQFQSLALANAAAKSASGITQGSDGSIEFSLPGGATTTNPGAGVWASWRLRDVFGRSCDVTAVQPFTLFSVLMHLREITPPALTADAWVGIGLANRSDINHASTNAVFGAIKYTGGVRGVRAGSVITGTAGVTDDASPQGDLRSILVDTHFTFLGQIGNVSVVGYDAAGLNIFGNFDTVSRLANAAFSSSQGTFLFLAAGRTAATAGTVALAAKPRVTVNSGGRVPS